MKKIMGVLLLLFVVISCTNEGSSVVKMSTNHGDVLIHLYGGISKYEDNFIKLLRENLHDSLVMHEVILRGEKKTFITVKNGADEIGQCRGEILEGEEVMDKINAIKTGKKDFMDKDMIIYSVKKE